MKEGVVCFRNVTLMTFLPDDVIANEEDLSLLWRQPFVS